MDNHSKEVRSYNMSRIHAMNTKPEEVVRKYLFKSGFRYRKNLRSLPGCPDIVLPKYKTVIFVNGCFWHMHTECGRFVWPNSNKMYWVKKITGNVKRDKENKHMLEILGWKVIDIWECTLLNERRNATHEALFQKIKEPE